MTSWLEAVTAAREIQSQVLSSARRAGFTYAREEMLYGLLAEAIEREERNQTEQTRLQVEEHFRGNSEEHLYIPEEETPARTRARRGLVNPNRRNRNYGNTNGYRF